MTFEFRNYGKIPRWVNEHVWISEKIDGSNSCIVIEPLTEPEADALHNDLTGYVAMVEWADAAYAVRAQSRNKFITPGKGKDNFGFAAYVQEHAVAFVKVLGVGYHYGEWYGSGIQSGYGLANGEKRFALFPTSRHTQWSDDFDKYKTVPKLEIAPELYEGPFGEGNCIEDCLNVLREHGSFAQSAYRFDRPEGVVVQFKLSGARYKAFVNEVGPKSLAERIM
jgi:hypothetical protein